MHSALCIAEIVQEILGFLHEKRNLKACSLVCWNWFHLSIDLLWGTINSVKPLMNLLGPIHFTHKTWVCQDIVANCTFNLIN